MRASRIMAAAAVLLAACTPAGSEPATSPAPDTVSTPTTTIAPTTTTTARSCPTIPPGNATFSADDAATLSLALSESTFPECAEDVVVAIDDESAISTASALAADLGAPLLVAGADITSVRSEIERLRPRTVTTVGLQMERFPETRMVEVTVDLAAAPPPTGGSALLVIDRSKREFLPIVAAYADQLGAQAVIAPRDLRRADDDTRLAIAEAPAVSLVGAFGPAAEWQLDVVRSGVELPGGGQTLFPGRRLVALYGTPYAPALGILGEQSPEESVQLVKELAASFEAIDGTPTVPAFDLITTVASAGPGSDGDYSEELTIDSLRPWVEAAQEAGVYVVLDLQPGRTDFLTQAKRYEEFLLLPHVGLALDPEWRLEPDQVHLRQVGSVTAAEVNAVSDWLASLVRDNALPQKLLVVHQFKLSMITERETLRTPPELAVVIQMDGQGPLGSKYGTFDAITAGAEDVRWRWGWKNFHDEDSPMATPEQTLAVDPAPVFISYQ